jgi:uncharacterized protein YdeI (YjbR/CyaY-like superfamily)
MGAIDSSPILEFKSPKAWEQWLAKHHDTSTGVFLQIAKKDSGKKTVNYAEALDVALCYGWIDGIKKGYDDKYFIQRFSPRKPKSIWSKINIGHIERLTKEGKMKAPGLKAVETAKANGSWENAYDSPSKMKVPSDFLTALEKNKKAKAFFETLNKTNLFSIAFRLHSAKKPETREKRMKEILAMLAKGEKFH